jgi:hypothetical protein
LRPMSSAPIDFCTIALPQGKKAMQQPKGMGA